MNLQVKSVVMFNREGKKRLLEFNLNAVNIITGGSQKGKSSIINIIDYCLGRAQFQISSGVISENVEWYGVLFSLGEFEIFIAKPKPREGAVSQSEAYLEIGSKITIPELEGLKVNSNDESISLELSSRIGISENLNIPEEGQTRLPLTANLSHTTFLLFQSQSVIANKEVLFYRQSEPFIPQSIKDTLPYFLGIIQEDRLVKMRELQDKRRKARLLRQSLESSEEVKLTRADRGISLIAEAKQVGLLESNDSPLPETIEGIFKVLSPALEWQPTNSPSVPDDQLYLKQEEVAESRKKFKEVQADIHAAETHAKDANGYLGEATHQQIRLESIELFKIEEETKTCPVCNHECESVPEAATIIRNSLAALESEVDLVTKESPEISEYIQNKKKSLETLRQKIKQGELDITALIEEQDAAESYREINSRIARVVGRISYYFDITTPTLDTEIQRLKTDLELIEDQIKSLEGAIDIENIEDRRASILNILSTEMTRLSKLLELEHQDPYRLDLNKLTVVVDRASSPIIMNQNMGSAANYLGSHLVALLALHTYFIKEKRPVPSFLVLDQLTQVYFPQEQTAPSLDKTIAIEEASESEDDIAVKKIFKLLFEVSDNTGLQIIVLEHAELKSERFQKALIDSPWRGDHALIPADWL